jgi:hypothetical protein
MISVRDAIAGELDSGALSENAFFDDIYHPTDEVTGSWPTAWIGIFGHSICRNVSAIPNDPDIPRIPRNRISTLGIGRQFKEIRLIDASSVPEGIKLNRGPLPQLMESSGPSARKARADFPNNWHKPADSANGDLVLELSCRNLMIVYKKSANADTAGAADFLWTGSLSTRSTALPRVPGTIPSRSFSWMTAILGLGA